MKLSILLTLAFTLHAEDAPAPTVEQLQAKVAEQNQQIVYLQKKLSIYQQGLFACQDAEIGAQAKRQSEPSRPAPAKPEDGKK
jgi:hypothetical protein